MSTVEAKTRHTPEDLLTMPEGNRYELMDDELVEVPVSTWSSYVAGKLVILLGNYCEARGLGWVFPEGTSYQCFPRSATLVRRADFSFIRLDRLSSEEAMTSGHLAVAPDLLAEVVSPNDVAYKVARKVQDYQEAGVRLIWIIYPEVRKVVVERLAGPGTVLGENNELTGEDVVPGFRCRVGDLFRLPTEAAPAAPPQS